METQNLMNPLGYQAQMVQVPVQTLPAHTLIVAIPPGVQPGSQMTATTPDGQLVQFLVASHQTTGLSHRVMTVGYTPSLPISQARAIVRPEGFDAESMLPSQTLLTPENSSQRVSCWKYLLAVVRSGVHMYQLFFIIYSGIFPPDYEGLNDQAQDYAATVRVFTILVGPFMIFETLRHWCRGTYFPMVAANSFYIVRFGTDIEKNPTEIKLFTVIAMVLMGFFLCICTMFGFLLANSMYCPGQRKWETCDKAYMADNEWIRWRWMFQWYMYLALAIWRIKRFVLVYTFAFGLTVALFVLSCVTCGFGVPGLLIFWCIFGFKRDSKFCNIIPMAPLYDMIAFFYRHL